MTETPDRRKKSQLVHVNLIRDFLSRTSSDEPGDPVAALCVAKAPKTVASDAKIDEETDGENLPTVYLPRSNGEFPNSHLASNIEYCCQEIESTACKDIESLISKYPEITADRPGLHYRLPLHLSYKRI